MAVTFPISLASFSDVLRVESLTLHCPTPKSRSQTRGGQMLQARLGPSLWQGDCKLAFAQGVKTGGLRALLDLLLDENASFLLSPHDYYGPAADPGGVILGGATVTLQAVATNARDVTLAGLPAGYKLTGDDLFSFTYGTNPTRHALHRVVFGATASSGGQITVEVWPRVRTGWAVGAQVRLVKPRFKAIMDEREPGASMKVFHSGASFTFIQEIR